jgi:hypothetical protein
MELLANFILLNKKVERVFVVVPNLLVASEASCNIFKYLWHVLEHEYKIDRNVLNQINESS